MIQNLKIHAICVDASCIGNPGVMEYQAVDLQSGKELFHSPLYPMGTNNLGEYLAIYDALRYIEKHPKKYELIFSDSETAIAWIKSKKIKTTLVYSPETHELLTKVQEANIWLKTHELIVPIRKRETDIR